MTEGAAQAISKWFREHDDGEFVRLPATHPYSVTAPSLPSQRILYTTKPHCVLSALEQSGAGLPISIIGRAGLPGESDAEWLQSLVADRVLLFLGDCDPADLLIFVWLRSQVPLTHLGVSDRLIQRLGVSTEGLATIPLTDEEREAFSLLRDLCPDYRDLIGARCAALLTHGHKLELEAVGLREVLADKRASGLDDDGSGTTPWGDRS